MDIIMVLVLVMLVISGIMVLTEKKEKPRPATPQEILFAAVFVFLGISFFCVLAIGKLNGQ